MLDLPPTMAERPVTLYIYEASQVTLRTGEQVCLNEVIYDETIGFDLEPYRDLLAPGEYNLELSPGVYHFRLVGDASLQVDPDTVIVVTHGSDSKDPWPQPPPPPPIFASVQRLWNEQLPYVFASKGEPVAGPRPVLAVSERRGTARPAPRLERPGPRA